LLDPVEARLEPFEAKTHEPIAVVAVGAAQRAPGVAFHCPCFLSLEVARPERANIPRGAYNYRERLTREVNET
jgi:hypothetical protein